MKNTTFAELATLRHQLQWLGAMRYVGTMVDRAAAGDAKALAIAHTKAFNRFFIH